MRPGPLERPLRAAAFVALALVATATSAAPPPRGALLLLDVPDGGADQVRAALAGRVLDAAKTKKILADAAAMGLGCPELTDACAAGFGQVSGLDEVVVVTVRPRGGARLVRAARLDARTGRVVDVTLGRLAERAGDGGVGVEVVAGNLFGKTKAPALVPLQIVVDPPGTPVLLDGAPATLVDGDVWVLPGPHALATAGGAAAITKIVVTDRGDPGRVELAVVAPPPSPTTVTAAFAPADGPAWPAIVTWSGVGVGVAGGLVALGVEVWLAREAASLDTAAERTPYETAGVVAASVGVAGAVVALVGAGLWGSSP
jgi:hypothetical protein